VDPKLFFTTFAAIFIAEMGDKTQLATLSAASGTTGTKWTVFAASALALVCTSAIAVVGSEALGKVLSPTWLKRGAGALFIVLGAWTLYESTQKPETPPPAATP
jgi:putative Ca2+/H+ antiporter (TMEM165/GDT1 family)